MSAEKTIPRACFLLAVLLSALTTGACKDQRPPATTASPSRGREDFRCPPAEAAEPPERPPPVKRVFLVMLENSDAENARARPFLGWLAEHGAYLANYHGLTNPSLGNYLALIGGDTFHAAIDASGEVGFALSGPSLAQLLEKAGQSWVSYAEDYPGRCFLGGASAAFVKRHEPFLYFTPVIGNPALCGRIVNATRLEQDLARGPLPSFVLYVPNLKNDGHDTGVSFADAWLRDRFEALLATPAFAKETLFVVTFDEEEKGPEHRIYASFYGGMVKPGATAGECYTHYDLLRTIEEVLGLGSLGRNDATARPVRGIWRGEGKSPSR